MSLIPLFDWDVSPEICDSGVNKFTKDNFGLFHNLVNLASYDIPNNLLSDERTAAGLWSFFEGYLGVLYNQLDNVIEGGVPKNINPNDNVFKFHGGLLTPNEPIVLNEYQKDFATGLKTHLSDNEFFNDFPEIKKEFGLGWIGLYCSLLYEVVEASIHETKNRF